MNNSNKFVILFVFILVCIGLGIGYVGKKKEEKQNVQTYEKQVNDYYSQFTTIINEMGDKLEEDPASNDHTVNTYILKTFDLYESVYEYTVRNDLLYNDYDRFQSAYKLMSSIYEWQMTHAERNRKNFLTGAGMAEIYVLEAEQNKKLTDELTLKACKDVLKVDPDNEQAQETLDRLYSNK
jgi:hypothetical protein